MTTRYLMFDHDVRQSHDDMMFGSYLMFDRDVRLGCKQYILQSTEDQTNFNRISSYL